MPTIDSVEFYMRRGSDLGTGNSVVVSIYSIATVPNYPNFGTLLGSKSIDKSVLPTTSPDWVAFTFDTPIEIYQNGFVGVHIAMPESTSYHRAGTFIYFCDTYDYYVPGSGVPYDNKEQSYRHYTAVDWDNLGSGLMFAYRLNCTDCTDNSAISPNASFFDFVYDGYEFGVRSYVDAETLPEKAVSPIPVHETTEVDFSDRTLFWENGGGATSYDVYIGDASDNLTKVSSSQAGISYITTEANIALFTGGLCYWRIDAKNILGTTTGDVWSFDARPIKPVNPAPEDEEKDVSKTTSELTWGNGGNTETFNIYFGLTSGNLTELYTGQDILEPNWPAPYTLLEIKDYNPEALSGYRKPVVGDVLTHGDTTYTIWKITRGNLVNVQYEAKLYAFRVGPECVAGNVLTNGVSPDPDNPQAVSVTLNDNWYFSGEAESAWYPYATRYYWRIDAVNEAGTTTGDEWYFDIEPSLYLNERMSFYDGSLQWQYKDGSYQWVDFDVSGGGRYKQNIVLIGHNSVYYG